MRKYKWLRRHQLGLVLIGMAISTPEAKKFIRERLAPKAIKPTRIRWCLDAIHKKEADEVRSFFAALGVDCEGKRVVEAIVETLHDDYETELLHSTLRLIMDGDYEKLGDAEQRLETALALVRHAKTGKLKPLPEEVSKNA